MLFQEILLFENNILYIKRTLEKLLNIKFTTHESSYWGIYYLSKEIEKIEIKDNFVDDDWQFDEDRDCPIVVSLNNVKDNDEILNIIVNRLKKSIKKVFISEINENYSKKYLT